MFQRQYAEDVLFGEDGGGEVGEGGDGGDTVHPLPGAHEFRRYEQRKRMGFSLLQGISPQQIANMSPELKASMDQFFSHLEAAAPQLQTVRQRLHQEEEEGEITCIIHQAVRV